MILKNLFWGLLAAASFTACTVLPIIDPQPSPGAPEASPAPQDLSPPQAAGPLSLDALGQASASLSWPAAQDAVSPAASLSYRLSRGPAAPLAQTVAEVLAQSPVMDWTVGALSATIDADLRSGGSLSLLVRDQAGNCALYPILSVPAQEANPPTLANAAVQASASYEAYQTRRLSLSWAAASDDSSPEASLSYRLVLSRGAGQFSEADIAAGRAWLGMDWTRDCRQASVGGLLMGTRYHGLVEVKDLWGNRSTYTAFQITTPASRSGWLLGNLRVLDKVIESPINCVLDPASGTYFPQYNAFSAVPANTDLHSLVLSFDNPDQALVSLASNNQAVISGQTALDWRGMVHLKVHNELGQSCDYLISLPSETSLVVDGMADTSYGLPSAVSVGDPAEDSALAEPVNITGVKLCNDRHYLYLYLTVRNSVGDSTGWGRFNLAIDKETDASGYAGVTQGWQLGAGHAITALFNNGQVNRWNGNALVDSMEGMSIIQAHSDDFRRFEYALPLFALGLEQGDRFSFRCFSSDGTWVADVAGDLGAREAAPAWNQRTTLFLAANDPGLSYTVK